MAVSFLTYLFGTLATLLFKPLFSFRSERKQLLVGRGVFGVLASFCYTISILFIPLTNSTLFFNTAPLFIPILSIFWLKEKISAWTWSSILIGFIGVGLIVAPQEASLFRPGNLIGLMSGLFLAIAYFFMKLLTKTEPPLRIIFYYLGTGALLHLPLLYRYFQVNDFKVYGYSLLAAFFLIAAQIGLIKAYQSESASKVGVFQYLTVVFVGLIDWYFFDAHISRQELLGISFVILGVFLLHK